MLINFMKNTSEDKSLRAWQNVVYCNGEASVKFYFCYIYVNMGSVLLVSISLSCMV